MKRIPWLALMILFLLPSVAKTKDPEHVELTLRFFPIHRQVLDGYYLQSSPGVFEEIRFRPRSRSDEYEYTGTGYVTVHTRILNPETQTYLYPVEFGFTATEVPSSDILIMVLPPEFVPLKDEEEQGWFTILLPDDPEFFKPSQLLVLNATGFPLDGVVDTSTMTLGFGERRLIDKNKRDPWVKVSFGIRLENGHELVYGNRLRFTQDRRSILVLRPPRRPRSIKIDTYLIEDMPTKDS